MYLLLRNKAVGIEYLKAYCVQYKVLSVLSYERS